MDRVFADHDDPRVIPVHANQAHLEEPTSLKTFMQVICKSSKAGSANSPGRTVGSSW